MDVNSIVLVCDLFKICTEFNICFNACSIYFISMFGGTLWCLLCFCLQLYSLLQCIYTPWNSHTMWQFMSCRSSMSSHVLQMCFFLQISLFYQLELVPSVQPMCRRIRYLWRSRNGTKYILDTLHHMYTFQEGTYMSRLHLRWSRCI